MNIGLSPVAFGLNCKTEHANETELSVREVRLGMVRNLYYYSSPVPEICPQNRTDFYPDGLNLTPIIAYICLRLHIASPRPLDRSLSAFVLCFLRQKIKKNFRIATVAMFRCDF